MIEAVEIYERFYTENSGRLMAYLMRLTGDAQLARDLMQESFARYLTRYGRGDNRALLFTIARNAAWDALRKCRAESSLEDEKEAAAPDPECRCIERESIERMMIAIRQLGALERELMALLATEAHSYKAIGRRLGISEGNVKIKVHRARLKLRSILADGEQ
jgi:RNA polymerase sigma factor (sigma-70 family)